MSDVAAHIRARGLVPRLDGPIRPSPLDVEIGPGSVTCLVGEHGDLRTAWLRALGDVDPPLTGRLDLLGGLDLGSDQSGSGDLRCRLGFVTRTAPLLSVINGLRNVMLPALYHRRGSYPDLEARARELIADVGCDADLSLLPAYLTERQRRQLAIARAVMMSPLVLMIDQPFGGLAPAARELIAGYLNHWSSQPGHALVVATDDLGFVKQAANRIIHVAAGGCYCFNGWQDYLAADVAVVQRELAASREAMAIFE